MPVPMSEIVREGAAARAAQFELSRRPLFPAIRWGAILAGVVVGISVQLAFTLLGIASGLSVDESAEEGLGVLQPLLWAGLSMLVASFVSGYIAARMSGLKRKADGVLHGAVAWAVTTILFAVFATAGGGGLMGSVLASLQPQESEMGHALTTDPDIALDPESLRRFENAISIGDRETAIVLLIMATGMDRLRAEGIVDHALNLAGSNAPRSSSSGIDVAAWIVFGAVALALVCGMWGGARGAAGARRSSWSGGRRLAYVAAAEDSDGNEDPGA